MTGQTQDASVARAFDRERLARLSDWVAVALAASLPWSTSATGILVVVWLLTALPILDPAAVRRELASAAGGLPVLLWALGVVGMLWADVSWSERWHGLMSFHKLLLIPLLLARFRQSDRSRTVVLAFLAACTVLLAVSWLWRPELLPWRVRPGVPVKDYISQSAMFTVCILMLAWIAADRWLEGRRPAALGLAALAVIFLANIFWWAPSRTAFVVIPILLVLFGALRFGWKGIVGALVPLIVVVAVAWPSSWYFQARVTTFFDELRNYRSDARPTPAGERLEFWKKSVRFVADAPVIGHGTGSISKLFREAAAGQTGVGATASANPHNQTFAVAIQLGLVGAAVLFAMWLAHLTLFWRPGLAAWFGLVVVLQNVVGSLFNSHLFDFTHGWLYVVGVGIAGGTVLREAAAGRPPAQ
jgi:hypothetical protein